MCSSTTCTYQNLSLAHVIKNKQLLKVQTTIFKEY